MPSSNPKLTNWVRDRLLDKDRYPYEFVLVHSFSDGGGTDLLAITVNANEDTEKECTRISEKLAECAEEHITTLFRRQRYVVTAKLSSGKSVGNTSFVLTPNSLMTDMGETEPPTTAGALSQTMRFQESMMRMFIQSHQATVIGQAQLIDKYQTRCEKLENKLMASFDEREELKSKQHERDLEALRVEKGEGRKDELLKAGLTYLAPVMPHIIGKVIRAMKGGEEPKVLPSGGSSSPSSNVVPSGKDKRLSELLEDFFKSLRADQTEKISELLDVSQQEKLMIIMSAANDVIDEPTTGEQSNAGESK